MAKKPTFGGKKAAPFKKGASKTKASKTSKSSSSKKTSGGGWGSNRGSGGW